MSMNKVYYCDVGTLSNQEFVFDDFPLSRIKYIESITHVNRKKQSYFVWKLLLYVLKSNNVTFDNDFFSVDDNLSKWHYACDDFTFSLSHSGNIVAVGFSNKKIGIDVEKVSININKIKKFIDNNDVKNFENKSYYNQNQILTQKWTIKESLFKLGFNDGEFKLVKIYDYCGDEYMLTCATIDGYCDFFCVDNNKL